MAYVCAGGGADGVVLTRPPAINDGVVPLVNIHSESLTEEYTAYLCSFIDL